MLSDHDPVMQRWYVTENDVVGGWAIVNKETVWLSQIWGRNDVSVVLEATDYDIAVYVTALHNERLGVRIHER